MRTQLLRLAIVATLFIATIASPRAQAAPDQAFRSLSRGILEELIKIPTAVPDGSTSRAAQAMAARLLAAGFPREDVRVLGPDEKTSCLVARYRGTARGAKPILLMAHIDVVPARREDWTVDPWAFVERDGWFYGRGTTDNKAGAAVLIASFVRLKQEGWAPSRDLIVALTGDEETSGASIEWLVQQQRALVDAEFALNTDAGSVIVKGGKPTLFAIQASEKIYADFQLEVTDAGGHSSLVRPNNPITTLSAALVRIGEYHFSTEVTDVARLFFERSAAVESGQTAADMRAVAKTPPDEAAATRLSESPFYNARLRTTCVATRLEGGHANNALPQMARAVVNCRILPGTDTAAVEATVRRLAGPNVKVTVIQPPVPSPPSPVTGPVIATIERLVAAQWPGLPVAPMMETGATDGLQVRRVGIPTYGVSALAEDPDDVRAHGRDERVRADDFYAAARFWYGMLKELTR